AERRLTAHGREQVLHSAAHLLGQPLQAIIASPYVRAQQTAALVHDTLSFAEPVRTVPWLTPEGDVQQVIGEIERLGLEHVLLVSQQPAAMSTASLAELEGEWPLAGLMTLRAIHSPA
ncbi:MAG: SixA phosphatase family protein, partial [Pseudomonas alloputida]